MIQKYVFFILSLLLASASLAAPRCADLLQPAPAKVDFKDDRIQLSHIPHSDSPAKLRLVEKDLSANPDVASMDILRMLLHTTSFSLNDKNVLHKNDLTLGLNLHDGYSLNLKYESDGRLEPRFNIAAIELVTPTGASVKIAKDFIAKHEFKLDKSEFEIPAEYFQLGKIIDVEIPVTINGKSLQQIENMAKNFELFTKPELRKIAENSTLSKFKRNLLIGKTKALFKKYFIAAPFKAVSNIIPTMIIASIISYNVFTVPKDAKVFEPPTTSSSWVSTTINEAASKSISPEVKILFSELKEEANQRVQNDSAEIPTLGATSVAAPKYKFSDKHMTWVFEQKSADGMSSKTYIVFTEEITGDSAQPIKYVIMQIDPIKYAEVIKLIQTQGKVLK